jgi:hypothetical protein
VSEFWCWHEGCPEYGKKGSGNIILKENNFAVKPMSIVSVRIEEHHFST